MQNNQAGPSGPATSASAVDRVRTSLINFLLEVSPPLIGCSRSQLQATLTRKAETELLKKFAIDPQARVLIGRSRIFFLKIFVRTYCLA